MNLEYLKQQKICCLAIFLGQKSRHGMTGFSAQGLAGMDTRPVLLFSLEPQSCLPSSRLLAELIFFNQQDWHSHFFADS